MRPMSDFPRELAIRTTLLPRDTNAAGAIFGGVILSQIDMAGAIPGRRENPPSHPKGCPGGESGR